MTHNNDTYITDTEDNVNKLQSDGDVTVPKEKFLFREPIVLISIVGLSLLDGLVLHLTPKNLAEYPTEVFTVYSLSVSAVPMVGLIFATLLSEVAGRRHVYRYLFALSVVLFILVVSPRHPTVMIMVFILRGMIRGAGSVMNAVAICEYSSPKHRFAWMTADVATANTIGPVISRALNTEIVFYTLLVIQIVLGLICMRCIWAWPESPYWLANKGNLEQSRTAFMWLRGKGGRKELDSMLKARRRPGPPKLFWISLFIALATVSVTTFSYVQVTQSSMNYLHSTRTTPESQFYVNLFGTTVISCALATVSYFIRRKLLFIVVSVISFILCYAEALCYQFDSDIDGVLFYLLHTTSQVIQKCGPLAFGVTLFVEITPHKYNTIISCICHIVMFLSVSFVYPLFHYFNYKPFHVSVALGLSTTLALVAALLYYFFAPETKDKTLIEIQRSYLPDENDSNLEQNEGITLNVMETLDELID